MSDGAKVHVGGTTIVLCCDIACLSVSFSPRRRREILLVSTAPSLPPPPSPTPCLSQPFFFFSVLVSVFYLLSFSLRRLSRLFVSTRFNEFRPSRDVTALRRSVSRSIPWRYDRQAVVGRPRLPCGIRGRSFGRRTDAPPSGKYNYRRSLMRARGVTHIRIRAFVVIGKVVTGGIALSVVAWKRTCDYYVTIAARSAAGRGRFNIRLRNNDNESSRL